MRLTPPHGLIRYVARRMEAEQAKLHADASTLQAKLLAKMVARYRDTAMGRAVGLPEVRSVEDFRRRVEVRSGDQYREFWLPVLESNPPGLVHPKPLKYMGVSSGSTGAAKPIPIPDDALATYRRFTNHLFFHAFHELGLYDLFDGNVLVAAGPPVKEVAKSGVLIGFGSGIATLESPRFARALIRPSLEVQTIADRDEKLARIADEALPLDVRAITGMPNAATAMLEHLLRTARARGRDVETARELFPNLRIYGYSGMPLAGWRDRILGLLGEGVAPYEIYSSTESPIAYQHRMGEPGLLIDLSVAFFELIAVDDPSRARIGLADAAIGRDYELIVSAWGGIFAYSLGDRIRLTSKNPYVLVFAGRTTEEINLAGEKVSLGALSRAIEASLRSVDRMPTPFAVAPAEREPGAPSAYELFLETDLRGEGVRELAASIDRGLRAAHHHYEMMRDRDASLGPLRLVPIPNGTIERALHAERTFGHAKLPPIQRDRAFVPSLMKAAHRDGVSS